MTVTRVHDVTCIVCNKDFAVAEDRDGWFFMQGFYEPGVLVVACPPCKSLFAVALDWAAERNDPAGRISDSVACAFAFHLGQYEEAARAQQWDVTPVGRRPIEWRSAEFCDPSTLGRHGWGRWSPVRRSAGGQHENLVRESELGFTGPPLVASTTAVHALHEGHYLCGPAANGAQWVRVEEWRRATCETCRHEARLRNGTHLVRDPNYGYQHDEQLGRDVVTFTGTSLCGLPLTYGQNWEAVSAESYAGDNHHRSTMCPDCVRALEDGDEEFIARMDATDNPP